MNEKQQDPLFLPQSLMRGDNCGFSQDVEDDFPLVFDSVYVLPDTPGLTASTRASDDGEKKAFRNSPPTQDEPRSIRAKTNSPNPQTKTNHIEKKTKNVLDFSAIFAEDMAKANGRGDFEALKAYFWSGAVDVID